MAGGCVVLVRKAEKRAKNCAGCSKPATLPGWVEGVEVDPGQSEPAIAPFSVPARPACAGIDGISVKHGPPGHALTTTTSSLLKVCLELQVDDRSHAKSKGFAERTPVTFGADHGRPFMV